MDRPPNEIDGAAVLKYAVVTAEVEPSGKTRHFVGGVLFGPSAALAIVQHSGESAFYLLYLNGDGHVVTDTWHASLDDALHQANIEYEGLRWTDIGDV